jgi:hypothetical protein
MDHCLFSQEGMHMAISEKTRESGSYQTHRVQFLREITSRADNTSLKDEDFLNCVLEPIRNRELNDTRQFIMKRAGVGTQIASVAPSEIRGMFFWNDQDKLFYSVGNTVYVYSFTSGINLPLAVFSTTSGEVGFCEYLYDTNQVVIIATDGTTLVQIDNANVVTTCTDPDLPTPHLPYPVFIDGYLFLAKSNSADVYNSDLNNPMSWDPSNFLSAEMKGDWVIRIATLNNYLLVFGSDSIEYYWDAANPSGTPMQRNDTPIKFNSFIGGFAQLGNVIYFVGESLAGQPAVYRLQDFKIEDISSYTVSRYLNTLQDSTLTWKAAILSEQGHAYYVLNAGNLTYVCDTENKVWGRWAYQQGTSFPVVAAIRANTVISRGSYFALEGNSSAIYYMDDTKFQDNGVNFTYKIVTEALDFDTLNRKTMARFSLVGDRPDNDSIVYVSWSDDDYQTYSTPREINMNQDLPSTYRLGTFRQRSFKLEYTDNYPFRLQKYEVDINRGIS